MLAPVFSFPGLAVLLCPHSSDDTSVSYTHLDVYKRQDLASLNCDIVQVAHHGQNGVDFEFYKELYPRIALFPTPKWLWNNDAGYGPNSGGWATKETRDWMARLCIKIYCTKNGDQVLE